MRALLLARSRLFLGDKYTAAVSEFRTIGKSKTMCATSVQFRLGILMRETLKPFLT